jgi:hypothetical protein
MRLFPAVGITRARSISDPHRTQNCSSVQTRSIGDKRSSRLQTKSRDATTVPVLSPEEAASLILARAKAKALLDTGVSSSSNSLGGKNSGAADESLGFFPSTITPDAVSDRGFPIGFRTLVLLNDYALFTQFLLALIQAN